MKAIILDDDAADIQRLLYEAQNLPELDVRGTFQDAVSALDYVCRNEIELAVLGMDMEEMDGIVLGRELRKRREDILLIYISGYGDCPADVLRLHPAAFLVKPYTGQELQYAVETAYLLSKRKRKRIFARTFGHFDVFVDGKPIMFKSAKAKELLAFLIDRRGGTVTTDQMISVLWEDRPNDESTQNLCSKLVRTLQQELKAVHAEEMLVVARGNRCVDTDTFQCDLYDLLDGSQKVREQYIGEYLVDYSWSENQTALLDRFLH